MGEKRKQEKIRWLGQNRSKLTNSMKYEENNKPIGWNTKLSQYVVHPILIKLES